MRDLKNDPENYYNLSKPFESSEIADESLKGFYDKIEEARKEYGIADVLIITKGSVRYEDGQIGQFLQHSQYGNRLNAVSMAAYAYGQLQAEERELLNKLIAGKS